MSPPFRTELLQERIRRCVGRAAGSMPRVRGSIAPLMIPTGAIPRSGRAEWRDLARMLTRGPEKQLVIPDQQLTRTFNR